MKTFQAATLTSLHDELCRYIVHATNDELDLVSSVDVAIHNTISMADSMEWEFDLKDLWLTKSRWTMMINQYIDRDALRTWLAQSTGRIGLKGRGIAVLRTKDVKPRGGEATGHSNKETRRWGSCMLAISYKAVPEPQITLYSRTSYLGYLSAMDLSVAWMAGRYLAKELGIPVEAFKFVWMNEALQYHYFKSMAYLLNHRNKKSRKSYRKIILSDDQVLKDKYATVLKVSPALTGTHRWMTNLLKLDKTNQTLGDMNYNTYRRIRRRYHTEVLGYEVAQQYEGWSVYKTGPRKGENKEFFKAYYPLPSVLIEDLDFSKLGLAIDKTYGEAYDGSDGEWDDDDD